MEIYIKDLGKVSISIEGKYDQSKEYEKLSVVYSEKYKKSYISKQDVPIGIDIENEDYWQIFIDNIIGDEEDITLNNFVLSFKNEIYNPDAFASSGRVYLRKNIIDGKNILSKDKINYPNTIYIIRYDFDLNGETIELPENCTLDFYGGSFKNGKLILNNTRFLHIPVDWKNILNIDIEGTVADGQMMYYNGRYQYWNGNKWIKLAIEDTNIDILQQELNFDSNGGTKKINIVTDGTWTLKLQDDAINNILIKNNKQS